MSSGVPEQRASGLKWARDALMRQASSGKDRGVTGDLQGSYSVHDRQLQ